MKLYQVKVGINPIYICQQSESNKNIDGGFSDKRDYNHLHLGLLNYANMSSLSFGHSRRSDFDSTTNPKYSEAEFEKTLKKYCRYTFDPFQEDCALAGFLNNNLIGAAPTGTGKTDPMLYTAHLALSNGMRMDICEPLKALSSDKIKLFRLLLGEQNVGIITGERRVNVHAPIRIMTPEVERNIVANLDSQHRFNNVACIAIDEGHFINDPHRGHVIEEIIMLTPNIQGLSFEIMSATMGNVNELQGWMQYARTANPITKVVNVPDYERNVPLEFYFFDAAGSETSYPHLLKLIKRSELNENVYKALITGDKTDIERIAEIDAFANYLVKNKDSISTELWRILNSQDSHTYKALGALSRNRDSIMQVMSSLKKENRGLNNLDLFKNERFIDVYKYLFEHKSPIFNDINSIHFKNMSLSPLCTQRINLFNLTNQAQSDNLSYIQKKELDDFLKTLEEYKAFDTEIEARKKENEAISTLHGLSEEFMLAPESLNHEDYLRTVSSKHGQIGYIQANLDKIFAQPVGVNLDKVKSLDGLLAMDNRTTLSPKVVEAIDSIQNYSPNNGTKLKELFYLALRKKDGKNIDEYITAKEKEFRDIKNKAALRQSTIENFAQIEQQTSRINGIYNRFKLYNGDRQAEKLIKRVNAQISSANKAAASLKFVLAPGNKEFVICNSPSGKIRVKKCPQAKVLNEHCDNITNFLKDNPQNQQLIYDVLSGKTDEKTLLPAMHKQREELGQIRAEIEKNTQAFQDIEKAEKELAAAREIFFDLKIKNNSASYEQINTYLDNRISSLNKINSQIKAIFSEKLPEILNCANFEELVAESKRQPLSDELKDTVALLKKYPQSVQDALLDALKSKTFSQNIETIYRQNEALRLLFLKAKKGDVHHLELNTNSQNRFSSVMQLETLLQDVLTENLPNISNCNNFNDLAAEIEKQQCPEEFKKLVSMLKESPKEVQSAFLCLLKNRNNFDIINRMTKEQEKLKDCETLLNRADLIASDKPLLSALEAISTENSARMELLNAARAMFSEYQNSNSRYENKTLVNKQELEQLNREIAEYARIQEHIRQRNASFSLNQLADILKTPKEKEAFDELFSSKSLDSPAIKIIDNKIEYLSQKRAELENAIQNGQVSAIEEHKAKSRQVSKQIETLNKFRAYAQQDISTLSLKRLRTFLAEKKDEKALASFDRMFKSMNLNITSSQAIYAKMQNLENRKKAIETAIQKRLNPESLKYNNILLLLGAFSNGGATSVSTSEVANNLTSYNSIDTEAFAKALCSRVPVISKERAKRLGLILAAKEERVLTPNKPSNIKTRIHPHQVIEHIMKIEKETGEDYFPAIYFISNKAECNKSAQHFVKNKVSLLTPQQQKEVEAEIEKFLQENPYIASLREHHLEKGINSNTLAYLDALKQGIGVHHRGLLPPFKTLMEKLFKEKKIKLIFSTDTVSAGLDFPAKTVFIDSLMEPFNDNAIMSSTLFKQKGGRAGRRGMDLYGRVIVVNNMPNTKNIAFELINAPSDNLNSHLRINYGSVLAMLNDKSHKDSISILDRSFSVFQAKNKKTIQTRSETSTHPVINQFEYTQNLLAGVERVLRRSQVARNKNNLALKDKRHRLYEEMAANPLCSVNRNTSSMRGFINNQRRILNNIIITLKGYPCLEEGFDKEALKLSPELLQNHQQLLSDIDAAIELVDNAIKTPRLTKEQKNELRNKNPEYYLAYIRTMTEMREKLNDNPFTSANMRINLLQHQKKALETLKTMLTDKNMADLEIKPVVKTENSGTIYDYFDKMFKILSEIHKQPNPLNDNNEPYFTQEHGIFKLTEKGLAAARIQGTNQIVASDLIYGEKALFKELTPQEILTIVSSISQGFDKERNGKMESSLPDKGELPEHLNLHFNTILSRINQIEKAQNEIGLKEGREIEFNTNLAKAFYSLAKPENSFDYVFRSCIDKTSVPGYMEGDFAEHILSTIDLLQQMREALTQKDIELKVKLGVAMKLLKKSPILEIFKEDLNLDSGKFVFVPNMNISSYRVDYKNINPLEINRVLQAANIPQNEIIYNEFYQIMNTSPASLEDYGKALKSLFTGSFPDEINKEAQRIMDIVDDFAATGYDAKQTAKDFKIPEQKLMFLIDNYGLDDPNITIRDFYNGKLYDGGYVFEHLSIEEFKDTLLQRASHLLKSKGFGADDAYVRENLSLVKRVPLYVPGKGIEIGEADAMVYDKKLKKVLLVAECKAGNMEEKLTHGLKTRLANIKELVEKGVDARTVAEVDGKNISLDKDAFSFAPEVHLLTTKKKMPISTKLEELVHYSRFDKVDIQLMSESLLYHLKSMLKHR